MKYAALIGLGLLGVTTISHAADVGLGVSAFGEKQNIYIPVLLNPTTLLEGHFAYLDSEESGYTTENVELGIGFFKKAAQTDKTNVYYGARFSYEESNFDANSNSYITTSSEQKGFKISPTIGFEYLITPKLSVGGEAEFYFGQYETDETNVFSGKTSVDQDKTGTDTRLVVRYFF